MLSDFRWFMTSNAGAHNPALGSQLSASLIHLPARPPAATLPHPCACLAMNQSPLPLPADCIHLYATAKSP
jgi:hypothetical protein